MTYEDPFNIENAFFNNSNSPSWEVSHHIIMTLVITGNNMWLYSGKLQMSIKYPFLCPSLRIPLKAFEKVLH